MRCRVMLLALALPFLMTSTGSAQHASPGVGFRLSPGVGFATATFGDDSPRSSSAGAFTLGGFLLIPVSGSTDITFEGTWRPTTLSNPHFDESFSSVYLMGGVEFGGGSVYVRPSLGVDFQSWSGSMAGDDSGTAGALGLAAGMEKPIGAGSWHIAPEAGLKFTVTRGLSSFLLIFSFGLGWRGGS
ncbi:MAG: porin family protein [Gemmatimonadetes bacterium]|nr:porin family protein [Gemmatimonadota bacterium]